MAANTDKFKKVAPNTGWQLDASGIANASVTNFGLVSASAIPTDTGVIITIDRIDAGGVKTPAKMERIIGVMSGNSVLTCVRGAAGTAQPHAGGAVVEIVISSNNINDLIDGILVEHGQDGKHKGVIINGLTATTSAEDTDEFSLWDSVTSTLLKITFANLKATLKTYFDTLYSVVGITKYSNLNLAEGQMINGKIVPSVTANNLTVALKTKAGTDPSATDPVYAMIGGTMRTITSALSTPFNAGLNAFGGAGSGISAKETDYFVYLGFNATDGVTIGFSRIPYANRYDEFSSTLDNEKYCKISTITNAAASDSYINIGRFAATLSGGAGWTWTVPTFTASNLIQRPIFETRRLLYRPTFTGISSWSSGQDFYYQLKMNELTIANHQGYGISNAAAFTFTSPFTVGAAISTIDNFVLVQDNSTWPNQPGIVGVMPSSTILKVGINPISLGGAVYGGFTASGNKGFSGKISFLI